MIRIIFDGLGRASRPLLIVFTSLLVVLIGILDYMTVNGVSIAIFYILPVSIAAWFLSEKWGIGISALSAVEWFAADYFTSVPSASPIVPYWNALVMFGIFSAGSLAISELRSSQLRETSIAHEIQAGLMLKQKPELPGLDFAATWLPASNVGGDCYDILPIDDSRVAICIADAAGHGVTAALLISHFQATLRMLSAMCQSPAHLCSRINTFMFENFGPANMITFFYGVFDTSTRTLTYTNAGQTRPILMHGNGTTCELSVGGIPLGVMKEFCYDEGVIALSSGDRLVMYTDGVLERKNTMGEMFGIHRLTELLLQHKGHAASAICDSIITAVKNFGWRPIDDDLTVLVLCVEDPQKK